MSGFPAATGCGCVFFLDTHGDVSVAHVCADQKVEMQKYMTHTTVASAACGCEYIRQD